MISSISIVLFNISYKHLSLYDRVIEDICKQEDRNFLSEISRATRPLLKKDGRLDVRDVIMLFEHRP